MNLTWAVFALGYIAGCWLAVLGWELLSRRGNAARRELVEEPAHGPELG